MEHLGHSLPKLFVTQSVEDNFGPDKRRTLVGHTILHHPKGNNDRITVTNSIIAKYVIQVEHHNEPSIGYINKRMPTLIQCQLISLLELYNVASILKYEFSQILKLSGYIDIDVYNE